MPKEAQFIAIEDKLTEGIPHQTCFVVSAKPPKASFVISRIREIAHEFPQLIRTDAGRGWQRLEDTRTL